MKALKHITLLFITLVALSSCEDNDDIYQESWFVDEFEIKGSHWNLVGILGEPGSYYEYVFDQIPLGVSYYDGIVTAYIFFDYKSKDEIQTPLPYTEYKHYINNDGEDAYYSIQYSYDVKADGTIAFKAHVSDYYTGDFNPGTQYFRVAIVW